MNYKTIISHINKRHIKEGKLKVLTGNNNYMYHKVSRRALSQIIKDGLATRQITENTKCPWHVEYLGYASEDAPNNMLIRLNY